MTRLISIALFFLAQGQVGFGQFFERATVLENVRVLRGDGRVNERGSIVIKGGRVVGLGADVDAPLFSSRRDLSGRTITAGLIDAWSTLGLNRQSTGSDELSRAWDGFDPFAGEILREALRHGVTTFYLSPGRSPGINGVGAVVRLTKNDDGSLGSLLLKDAALSISFGPADLPIKRLKTFEAVRKQFRDALAYRESLEDYEEELKEYLEKLEVRRKEKEESEKAEPEEEEKPAETDEAEASPKPEPKPEDSPKDEHNQRGSRINVNTIGLSVKNTSAMKEPLADDGGSDEDKKDEKGEGEDKDKEDEITKPTKPSIDRVSELLLRSIDHELRIRILAQRSDGIFNALALAEEFNLDVTIEGATEAYLVASELADAEINLILGQVSSSDMHRSKQFRRFRDGYVNLLQRAGVGWTVSSGAEDPLATRFVALRAQLAASQTYSVNWMSLVTQQAARMLGIYGRAGLISVGASADLVVWSSNPSEPDSVVEIVYVAGKLVYDRAEDTGDGGGS